MIHVGHDRSSTSLVESHSTVLPPLLLRSARGWRIERARIKIVLARRNKSLVFQTFPIGLEPITFGFGGRQISLDSTLRKHRKTLVFQPFLHFEDISRGYGLRGVADTHADTAADTAGNREFAVSAFVCGYSGAKMKKHPIRPMPAAQSSRQRARPIDLPPRPAQPLRKITRSLILASSRQSEARPAGQLAAPIASTGMVSLVIIETLLSSASIGIERNWAKAECIAPGCA
jgi:hypothetical protein